MFLISSCASKKLIKNRESKIIVLKIENQLLRDTILLLKSDTTQIAFKLKMENQAKEYLEEVLYSEKEHFYGKIQEKELKINQKEDLLSKFQSSSYKNDSIKNLQEKEVQLANFYLDSIFRDAKNLECSKKIVDNSLEFSFSLKYFNLKSPKKISTDSQIVRILKSFKSLQLLMSVPYHPMVYKKTKIDYFPFFEILNRIIISNPSLRNRLLILTSDVANQDKFDFSFQFTPINLYSK